MHPQEGMKEHPEVKRYLEWREMHKVGVQWYEWDNLCYR